ncbi:glucosidase [Candidatus Aerophobetes bacterium]|uniref:Glucosidase n=1 Tax=Aerophobetes bacterium TaxID=2030807 RepID=A0A2A4X3S9_UNCAE|nr:MAG: glucosidase [Candidatus Aerophobetes bacterium]
MEKFRELPEESLRLLQTEGDIPSWEKWGPYVAERSWGTKREIFEANQNAWEAITYATAPFTAYQWGEDGIAGICDRYQIVALTHAFWNGKDPIIKERLFGLSNPQGNHGEDIKEYFYYLDNIPSHSYMKYHYKYPINAFPYETLIQENKNRSGDEREFELEDTSILDNNAFFDITIEYVKFSRDDIGVHVEFVNQSEQSASLYYLPQITFRNQWSWDEKEEKLPSCCEYSVDQDKSMMKLSDLDTTAQGQLNFEYKLGEFYFSGPPDAKQIFTNNLTNHQERTGEKNASKYTKDAFHRYLIDGDKSSINPKKTGTKGAFVIGPIELKKGEKRSVYLRLQQEITEKPLQNINSFLNKMRKNTQDFYNFITPKNISEEEKQIYIAALSSMLWSKQIYLFDVSLWIERQRKKCTLGPDVENLHWKHLISKRILSVPDKWEYPWFAAWDLAFHCLSYALVDLKFAKDQLSFLLLEQFQHPNGQIPAYEWNFSELNPPVHAYCILETFLIERKKTGKSDISFLKKCYHKLILNFVWWVNKVDTNGNNIFEGGFLGLDNIALFDRSDDIPHGGSLEQSDGTGWMGLFCLTLMRMSLELAKTDNAYESMAIKFLEHFAYIAHALVDADNREVQNWDEEDGFFYDVIKYSDNTQELIKIRSLVGIIPLFAVDCITEEELAQFPSFASSFSWFLKNQKELCKNCVTLIDSPTIPGKKEYFLSLMDLDKTARILERVWDEEEFRSPYGLRSLSKFYKDNPYTLGDKTITYEPAEAHCSVKGGNSNWRGPVWFPTTFLLISSLKKLGKHTDHFFFLKDKKTTPTMIAEYYRKALISLFLKDKKGNRPIYNSLPHLQNNPLFSDKILFFEHFDAETGRGLGAMHQTGWTGLVANLIENIDF